VQGDVAAAAAAALGSAARLRLEVDPRIGNGGELRSDAALDLRAGPLPVLAQRQVEAGTADVHTLDDVDHSAHADDLAGAGGGLLRLGAGRAGRQEDANGAEVAVLRRHEGEAELRKEYTGQHQSRDAGDHGGPAVPERELERPQVAAHDHVLAMRLRPMRFQHVGGHQRRDQARDEQAHQHGHDDGEPEILEELARNARHQATGRNTATIAMVVASTARPISSAASIDAW
jgi:hypothetical protein